MEYFRIRQDSRYLHTPVITNSGDVVKQRKQISLTNAKQIPDVNVLFSDAPYPLDFVDVLDKQFFLISMEMKKVFQMYEPGMIFKNVCILNNQKNEYHEYALPLFYEVDCLSEKSQVSPDKSHVKKLCLRHNFDFASIFKVAGFMTDVVILRLDAAESLLRRGIYQYRLESVEIEEMNS